MKLGTHDVVVVASKDIQTLSGLPVPDTNGLIVRCRQNPGIFVMKLHRADVVQMTHQIEQATSHGVIPNFNLVVVATRHKQWLSRMKIDATNRACVSMFTHEKQSASIRHACVQTASRIARGQHCRFQTQQTNKSRCYTPTCAPEHITI
jgi:hypothetical protein